MRTIRDGKVDTCLHCGHPDYKMIIDRASGEAIPICLKCGGCHDG